MRIKQKTITVTLDSEDGAAIFVFERMKANAHEKLVYEISKARQLVKEAEKDDKDVDALPLFLATKAMETAVLKTCKSVKGLEYEDGKPITVKDVREKNLDSDILELILAGYTAAATPEAEVKNEPSEPESPKD